LIAFASSAYAATSRRLEAPPRTLAEDFGSAPGAIGHDLVEVFSTPFVWLTLAGSYAGGEALDLIHAEGETTRFFSRHSILPDAGSRAFETLGQGYVLIAGAGAWYLAEREAGDSESVANSQHLLRSLAVTGISTLAFKTAFNDQRPSGGGGAYPSGHTSMVVATATSLWLTEGPKAGVPALILASLVALQRLDSQAHELDDVIGGATLGWVVTYSLERREPPMLLGARGLPAYSPRGDPGISLLWSY
jgi:membrane-associated phospholipid phosphatase